MELTYLLNQANALNGCEQGIGQLRECKKTEDLIECYFDRIDYCLAKDFPSLDFLLRYRDELSAAGVYINEKTKLHNTSDLVLLGNCEVRLTLTDWVVSRVYVKGESKLYVKASGNSVMMIDALDNCEITVEESDNARVIVNLYANAKCTGASRIIQKNKMTYDLQTQ